MMYDTFYTTDLMLLKNRLIKPTFFKISKKKKKEAKKIKG